MRLPAGVKRGAEYLDAVYPQWEEAISVDALDLDDCECCILGQLYGTFNNATTTLGLDWRDAQALGFMTRNGQRFAALTAAWAAVVKERLTR